MLITAVGQVPWKFHDRRCFTWRREGGKCSWLMKENQFILLLFFWKPGWENSCKSASLLLNVLLLNPNSNSCLKSYYLTAYLYSSRSPRHVYTLLSTKSILFKTIHEKSCRHGSCNSYLRLRGTYVMLQSTVVTYKHRPWYHTSSLTVQGAGSWSLPDIPLLKYRSAWPLGLCPPFFKVLVGSRIGHSKRLHPNWKLFIKSDDLPKISNSVWNQDPRYRSATFLIRFLWILYDFVAPTTGFTCLEHQKPEW